MLNQKLPGISLINTTTMVEEAMVVRTRVNHENMTILNIAKDPHGPHLKLEVTLPDGKAVIRWGLVEADYSKLRDIVTHNHFDRLDGNYYYELVPFTGVNLDKAKGKQKFIASVRCVQGQKAAKIEFECTERFAGNMEWFRLEVKGLKDLESLRWENLK